MGFTQYCVTEHAPLPDSFKDHYAGVETGLTEAAMSKTDIGRYLVKIAALKQKYRSQIHIKVGFEIDYLPTEVEWTKAFMAEYGPQTDENILSLHFLQGVNDKFWCVDDTPEDFQKGLMARYFDPQDLYAKYLSTLLTAVREDWRSPSLKRIGHLTLFKKFQDIFGLPNELSDDNKRLMGAVLATIKAQGFEIDYNAAGLYKPSCNEAYPDWWTVQQAKAMGIPLVYGSDAHSVAEVGQGIHDIETRIN